MKRTRESTRSPHSRLPAALALATTVTLACGTLASAAPQTSAPHPEEHGADKHTSALSDVIPAPTSVEPDRGAKFRIKWHTGIHAPRGNAEANRVARYLQQRLRPSTRYGLLINRGTPGRGDIVLSLDGSEQRLGEAGYRMNVDKKRLSIRATSSEGLFNGVQTLRQLLPAKAESDSPRHGPWKVPAGEIVDKPRFEHRSAMLDVARHFFDVDQVKRYIDQIAQYKINYLHLHLTDDQGWRIQIDGWPRLTSHGGSTEVGGGDGGYYTKREYAEIVDYAAENNVTIVPEIDMPGHTNAALSSYAELNCDGKAPPLYTGIEVGFSSLCVDKEVTYRFVDDVIRQVAAMTPGQYLHIGGDEAHSTTDEDYRKFMSEVLPMVEKHGKTPLGWHEYAQAEPSKSAMVQYWGTTRSNSEVAEAADRGNDILLSPANKAYVDQKYNPDTELGLDWAGPTTVRQAYDWNPGDFLESVPDSAIAGVEAPLFSETVTNSDEIEFMAFPRMPAIAELGWSSPEELDWSSFRRRLAGQAASWQEQGIDFYRSEQVPWPGN
ncbi:beta-N-acetylhexosaminidase [Actinopolyspora saharensis]|uniref:beta-N-acetylhexosaminidase n=1 Tax=Actinopolyspora saharensis TaxID=995062 RepID=A0A1H1A821_9ACTN|nr:beta-N-acetylhexosaminidase [Actinopolyspora saharensis]SDQ35784.1 hexosaminidase [Actinopolyspora saharensis]